LKKAILNRKNALFYRTLNGAAVGDLFMSLIHTCELNGTNPFHCSGTWWLKQHTRQSGCHGISATRWHGKPRCGSVVGWLVPGKKDRLQPSKR
jgi:hypothetical protein